jgi:hypothetical protein
MLAPWVARATSNQYSNCCHTLCRISWSVSWARVVFSAAGGRRHWPSQNPTNGMASEIAWSDTDGFIFVRLCEGQYLRPPLPTRLHGLKTRIREDCANTDQEIVHNVWQEVEHRFDVVRATRGAHTELYCWQITVHKTFSIGLSVGKCFVSVT